MEQLDDAALESQFEAEFAQLASRMGTIRLSLTPIEAWALIGQIQLACRHPENMGPSRQMVERIARRLAFIVAPEGALAIVAERGWNPQYDVPRDKEEPHA